jgi:hypothetical protein
MDENWIMINEFYSCEWKANDDEQTNFIYYGLKLNNDKWNFIHVNEKWMMLTKFHTLWMKIK